MRSTSPNRQCSHPVGAFRPGHVALQSRWVDTCACRIRFCLAEDGLSGPVWHWPVELEELETSQTGR